MSNIILPEDPDFDQPIVMGDPFTADPKRDLRKQGITPGTIKQERQKERDNSPNTFRYADSVVVSTPDPLFKQAQQTGVDNMMTNPMWFSPLHTPQNWQIASKRREVYQWNRFWYENEPKVAAAIDFYCFAPETQILMANGSQKSISSIEPGDLVRSHDGTTNQVVRTFARKANEKMLSISISGVSMDRALRVTEGHELLTQRDGEIKFVQAGSLDEGDYLLTPVEYSDSINEKTVDADFAWLLGLYAAEGCGIPYEHTDKNGHYSSYYKGVYFTLSSKEDELAEKAISIIHRMYGENKTTLKKIEEDGIQRIAAYGKGIADDLIGLCPGMAKDASKRFSPIVMKFANEDLLHLLAGFLDGDGCFNKNNGFQGVGVSKSLSEQIANICDKLGIEYSFTSTRISKENRQTCYNIRISRRACRSLEGLTYKINDNCVDETKIHNTPYYKEGKYIFRKIRSIKTHKYTGTVYDLEIENSHSYVANRISCHNSRFPMNGFNLECPDSKVLSFFEHHVADKLKLNERFKEISSEYYTLGDVFIHTDIDCEICGGIGVDPDTKEVCDHPGGTFKRIFVMNPDWIEVQKSPLTDEPLVVLIPDEELQQIVHKKSPKPIYDRIPDHLKPLIIAKAPIPMSNRTLSHLKHMNVPYGTYGTSIIRRLFTTLAYKTKIMTANWIVAERLILPVRVVKIGSDDRPASSVDIADVQTQLSQVANDPNLTIVTHHNFDYEWYGTSGKVLQITQEMEHIDKELLDGLMLNQALLNGEMSGYQSAQVGVETLIRRIESWRASLAEWCEDRVFKPVAEMQGFIDEKKSDEVGETVFLHPTIKWNDLELKDKTQYHQMLMQLHDKQVISTQTLLDEIGLNYDQEVKRMRYEQAQLGPQGAMMGQGMGAEGAGGAMGGGGGGMPGGAASPAGGEGMPGMGMDPMGGAGGMGGGMDMGGGGMAGGGAAAGATGKITKKGKGSSEEEEVPIPMLPIKLTKIEQKMAGMLTSVATNMGFDVGQIRMQFPVENPKGGKAFSMDFAIPGLKIDIEADGEVWHSSQEQTSDDQERDNLLAQRGWTILRFDDKSIEESTQQVEATINSYIGKAMEGMGQGQKQASVLVSKAAYFAHNGGTVLKDFKGDGSKYYMYLNKMYPSRSMVFKSEEFQQ